MFELICVTHRGLCADDLPQRVAVLCRGGVSKVILREKDLPEEEYEALARQVLAAGGDKVVLHHFPQVCQKLDVPRLHLSLGQLEADPALREQVKLLGVSIHAPEEAVRAQKLGADYVTAGHVFATDCKKGGTSLAGGGGESGVHPGVCHRRHRTGQSGCRGPNRGGGSLPHERFYGLSRPADLCGRTAANNRLNAKGAGLPAPFFIASIFGRCF